MANIDIYEMRYRDIQHTDNILSNVSKIQISDQTNEEVHKILKEIHGTKSEYMSEIMFSRASYDFFPKVDKDGNLIINERSPIFTNKDAKGNPKEYTEKFKSFDVNKLPLIEVAKYIGFTVEKSSQLKFLGQCRHEEKKIIMGSDYSITFLHELAHAIDHLLPDYYYEENYSELVAELSAVVIAKYFNIPFNLSYSYHYLDGYSNYDVDAHAMLKRVKKIFEFVKQAKSDIFTKAKQTIFQTKS